MASHLATSNMPQYVGVSLLCLKPISIVVFFYEVITLTFCSSVNLECFRLTFHSMISLFDMFHLLSSLCDHGY